MFPEAKGQSLGAESGGRGDRETRSKTDYAPPTSSPRPPVPASSLDSENPSSEPMITLIRDDPQILNLNWYRLEQNRKSVLVAITDALVKKVRHGLPLS
jgi:hypothetical protein